MMQKFLFIGGPQNAKVLSLKIAESLTVFFFDEDHKQYQYQRCVFHAENQAQKLVDYWDFFLWGDPPSDGEIHALIKRNDLSPHKTHRFL